MCYNEPSIFILLNKKNIKGRGIMAQTEYLYSWNWTGYNPIGAGWETCDPGHTFGPGIRDFYIIHYVLSGTGTYIIRGKEYHPQPGYLFALAPYETVYYTADNENPRHYVWINFFINGDVPYRFETPVIHAPELRPIFLAFRNILIITIQAETMWPVVC